MSMMVFAHLDIHLNVVQMNVKNTIEYCCFATLTNQGTSGVAEIHRCLMKDRIHYKTMFKESNVSFFEFMVDRWREFMPEKAVGACSGKRFTFPNCKTDWSELSKELFDVLKIFWTIEKNKWTKKNLDEVLAKVTYVLRDGKYSQTNRMLFPGAGPFTTIMFLQLASLLGLIPLYCFSYADIHSSDYGPGSLIKVLEKNEDVTGSECNDKLVESHACFEDIWGEVVTKALFENMFCEFSRSYSQSLINFYKKHPKSTPKPDLDIIADPKYRVESSATDIIFNDEARNCVQNFFLVRQTGKGESDLRPMLLMKHSSYSKQGKSSNDSIIKLTNWMQDSSDPLNMYWKLPPSQMKLTTRLCTSLILKSMMKITDK